MKLNWPHNILFGLLILCSIEVCGQLSLNYSYGLISSEEPGEGFLRPKVFNSGIRMPSFDVSYTFEHVELGVNIFSFQRFWELPDDMTDWDNSVFLVDIRYVAFNVGYRVSVGELFSLVPSIGIVPYHKVIESRYLYQDNFSHCCNFYEPVDKTDIRFSLGASIEYVLLDRLRLNIKYSYVRSSPSSFEKIHYDQYSLIQFSYGVFL